MVILLHVFMAIASLAYTTFLLVAPARASFRVNYGLIALTTISGTYLIFSSHSRMLESCMTGLAYLAIVTLGTVLAYKQLAKATVKIK